MSIGALVEGADICICAGAGGVGKTSTSAAIALGAAQRGRKAAVLTIDPARRLANALGLPLDRVRVRAAPIGGAFGGKLGIAEPLVAAAALKLQRPVRLVFGPPADFNAAHPGPGRPAAISSSPAYPDSDSRSPA